MAKRFLAFLLLVHGHLFAQNIPFPTDNTIWVNHSYSAGGWWPPEFTTEYLSTIENFCVNNEDTIINSSTYTKLNRCDNTYRGAFRDNGSQIYFVSKDSLNEMLLYDFTVNIGDTLLNIYTNWAWYDTVYVHDIAIVPIAGMNRKTIYLQSKNLDLLPDYWIEGIGCSAGLLVDPAMNNNLSGVFVRLNCFSTNDSTFNYNYSYTGSGSCNLNYLTYQNNLNEPFQIYPNPANTLLNVSFNTIENGTIQILDLTGKLIYYENIHQLANQIQIDLAHYECGTYILQLKTETSISLKKLVVYH